ncbi:hypothetical protein J437_LFUL018772 [Ladona fulva]|nr:hypothetical protein J437_LFUL018772 [Ladona fulva]
MAVGKNKGLSKGGKKGVKKKIVDPFTRKDWYDVKAPSMFASRQIGKTLVNRTTGTKIASEGLKGRVFEVSLADLQNENDAERSFRKFRLIAEYVQGRNVLTNFHGMDLTTDKLRSVVKKWQTLIEANVDVKTTDGYLLRVFCIGFTLKDPMSQRKTCYAQHTQDFPSIYRFNTLMVVDGIVMSGYYFHFVENLVYWHRVDRNSGSHDLLLECIILYL